MLAVHKKAGIPTQTSKVYEKDLVSLVTAYLSSKERPDPNAPVFVGLINRLDQPVEGIVLFGLNKRTTAELTKLLNENRIEKHYYAAVSRVDSFTDNESLGIAGVLEDYLLKNGKTNTSSVVDKGVSGAKRAVLEYQMISTMKDSDSVKLMDVHLVTGRHHQIRVQLSNAGLPLLGDNKYAPKEVLDMSQMFGVSTVALCAYSLTFEHPVSKEKVSLIIEPQGKWFELF